MTDNVTGTPDEAWDARVKAILKSELKRKGVTYAQLVDRLAIIGVKETEPNIRNKLARGKFTAVFLFKCLLQSDLTKSALTKQEVSREFSLLP